MENRIVIVGAGHAGGMVAIMLRRLKFKGSIIIIGNEIYPPYQRPALSKGFLSGEVDMERLFLKKDSFYKKNNISLVLGREVERINRKDKNLILDNKEIVSYSKLVIATGSKVIKLEENSEDSNLNYIRDINHSKKLSSQINSSKEICIIGSGYIGLETAAVARKKKLNVVVIENENRVMKRVVSKDLSSFIQAKHESEGVIFILNKSAISTKKIGDIQKLTLNDSSEIKTEIIAIGIGVKPNIDLAKDSNIQCNNGIMVDENCLSSDNDIYAIGDCSNHFNHIYNRRIRLESVHNAVEQAKVVTYHILGDPMPYIDVPWFWSDQYNIKLQIAGISESFDQQIIKGNKEREKFTIFYFKNEVLIALDAINSSKDFILGKKLIGEKSNISDPKMIALLN